MPTAKYQGTRRGAPYRTWQKTRLANAISDWNTGKYTWQELSDLHHFASASSACQAVRTSVKKHLKQSNEEVRETIERSYKMLHEKLFAQLMKGGVKPEVAAKTLIAINRDWSKLSGLTVDPTPVLNLNFLENIDKEVEDE